MVNKISEIKGLDTLQNLYFLNLSSNHIKDIKSLDQLKNLEMLYLDNNEISEIKGLQNLDLLSTISLERNKISDTLLNEFRSDFDGDLATEDFVNYCRKYKK